MFFYLKITESIIIFTQTKQHQNARISLIDDSILYIAKPFFQNPQARYFYASLIDDSILYIAKPFFQNPQARCFYLVVKKTTQTAPEH